MQSLIFFGSDQYSSVVLRELISSKTARTITVVTDHKSDSTPVEKLAKEHNLKVFYYPDFDHSLITKDTLGLCASFDHLLPPEIINLFAGNLYNLHPSLLPQYRNVSPVQYALAMGDRVTGITLFRISAGIDNGEIVAQARENILDDDTTESLTPRLFKLGAELFLNHLITPGVKGNPHSGSVSTPLIFTHRLTRDSGFIEWPVLKQFLDNQPVLSTGTENELLTLRLTHNPEGHILHDLIRALSPWPSVWSLVPSKKGELRISLTSHSRSVIPDILIAGKPKAISYNDFVKYYL